jgi:hypothetical protein
MKRIRLPRMNQRDVEMMLMAHEHLAAAHQTISQSNLSSRHSVLAGIHLADVLIARLYNRCERAVLGDQAAAAPDELVNDQSGLTARVESNGSPDLKPTE